MQFSYSHIFNSIRDFSQGEATTKAAAAAVEGGGAGGGAGAAAAATARTMEQINFHVVTPASSLHAHKYIWLSVCM